MPGILESARIVAEHRDYIPKSDKHRLLIFDIIFCSAYGFLCSTIIYFSDYQIFGYILIIALFPIGIILGHLNNLYFIKKLNLTKNQ